MVLDPLNSSNLEQLALKGLRTDLRPRSSLIFISAHHFCYIWQETPSADVERQRQTIAVAVLLQLANKILCPAVKPVSHQALFRLSSVRQNFNLICKTRLNACHHSTRSSATAQSVHFIPYKPHIAIYFSLGYISAADSICQASVIWCSWLQNLPYCVKQCKTMATGPSKLADFGTDRKPVWDFFPLVNNDNNLYPVLHCFRVTVANWSSYRFRQGVALFNCLIRGEPLNSEKQNSASKNCKHHSIM